MTWFGTDAVALACILGGAAVSGRATLAMMDGGEWVESPCVVESRARAPRVVVAGGDRVRTVVVTPDVRVHAHEDCGAHRVEAVEVHIDGHLNHFEAQESYLQEMEVYMEAMESHMELQLEPLLMEMGELHLEFEGEFGEEIEARVEAEMKEVKKRLKKMGDTGIRSSEFQREVGPRTA